MKLRRRKNQIALMREQAVAGIIARFLKKARLPPSEDVLAERLAARARIKQLTAGLPALRPDVQRALDRIGYPAAAKSFPQ